MSNARRKPKGPLQTMIDRERVEAETQPLIDQFRAQHGDYERNLRFITNRGGTAIDRWVRAGLLSDSQQAGIQHCARLWAVLRSPRLVVDMDAAGGGDTEGFSVRQIDALNELHRMSSEYPFDYWQVFENVCRHDLPAGVAGSRLANRKRSAIDAARMIVCFIADMIAMKERLSY